jgi:hypothetical protein
MTLRLVYRIYGGENLKGRPDYYSKAICLASFLRAAEAADAQVVLLADGDLPDHLTAMVQGRGEVAHIPGGPVGMRKSYLSGLDFPRLRKWQDEDIVYFSEDDYLHAPDAFVHLRSAAAALEEASYFALYASTPDHPAFGPDIPLVPPKDWTQHPTREINGQQWVNVPSTASTFGARVGMLRADRGIFLQGMLPYRTRHLDHELCVVYQGRFPYSFADLFLGPTETRYRTGVKALLANGVLTPFRVAYQLRSITRRRHPHLLYAADPNLACHMETQFLSPGVDWEMLAAATTQWAQGAGLLLGPVS